MKAFLRITEAVLAIAIMYTAVYQMGITASPQYSDVSGTERLHRFASDIALSLCNNDYFRSYAVDNRLEFLAPLMPGDVDYHVYLYDRNGALVNESGNPMMAPAPTSSCIISGYYSTLNSSKRVYAPKKIVVGVWNK